MVKAALARNASALILAHNHPSGNLNPSRQDEK
ncbi:MAG: JAB domain-containing protein [Desulfobulbus sp.]|nr:JAB domain-containing protein [Desulfobulbus sp.]